jgi:hypothetical protein
LEKKKHGKELGFLELKSQKKGMQKGMHNLAGG